MSPEFGATSTLFPIDDETLAYLRLTGRTAEERLALVEAYAKAQGLWRAVGAHAGVRRPAHPRPRLGRAVGRGSAATPGPRAADDAPRELPVELPGGPRALVRARIESIRPEGGVVEESSAASFPASDPPSFSTATATLGRAGARRGRDERRATQRRLPTGGLRVRGEEATIRTGLRRDRRHHVVHQHLEPDGHGRRRALARNAVARGLRVSPTVKTSLAPGSKAVTGYLENAGLMAPLEQLGFALAGYGCTTCIGNSGPLDEPIAEAIEKHELVTAAVLSGNRNFEGRIHPLARASYLASPPLVVAFALAGRVDIDLTTEPLGIDDDGRPVFLADIWPSPGRDQATSSATRSTPSSSVGRTRACSTATTAGAPCRSRPATATTGTPPRRTSRGRRSSRAWRWSPSRRPTSSVPACWPSWATR